MNGRIAVTFAVETDPPWGLLRGGLIDAAVVREGEPGPDLLSVFDFLPDNWAGWPNTYVRVEVPASGPESASVRVERDWGKAALVTVYTLNRGEDRVEVLTALTQPKKGAVREIASGYALWPKKGFILTPPGMKGARRGGTGTALTDWFAGYDRDWAMALHAPFADWIDHYGKGMFKRHAFGPGDRCTFRGWLQICPEGHVAPVLDFEMERKGHGRGHVSGGVTDEKGIPVAQPVILVEKEGALYCWTQGKAGRYTLDLPEGEYRIQATAYRSGATEPLSLQLKGGEDQVIDFAGLKPPARLCFEVTDTASGEPLDARIGIIEGRQPQIGFLGQKTFFTDLDRIGRAGVTIAPGEYLFEIRHGAGFRTRPRRVRVTARPDREEAVSVSLDRLPDPRELDWYGADLHHHGDILDGAATPEEAVRSQLAAGLDVLFLSDHDTTANNPKMAEYAGRRGVLFLPAMEISRSWGHFNIYPIMADPRKTSGPVTGSPREIFRTAREMGAEVIVANHPYSTYGYFRNLDLDAVPGGFDANFDLMEINYQHPVEPVIRKIWDLWNGGTRCYLTAGTDSHDVRSDISGSVRTYVHLQGEPSVDGLVAALKEGRSFATFGPLVFPDIPFGSRLTVAEGTPLTLGFRLLAANGLEKADLVEKGETAASVAFQADRQEAPIAFSPIPCGVTWYALVVTDREGKCAYTNPIWVFPDRPVSGGAQTRNR